MREVQLLLTNEQEEALGEQLWAVLAYVAHGAQVPVLRVPVPRAPLQLRQRHHLGGHLCTLHRRSMQLLETCRHDGPTHDSIASCAVLQLSTT